VRIVQINDLSRPQGGASALATALAEGLARRGSQVTFLCGDEGANSALADAGVDIHGLGSARLLDLPRSRALLNGLYNHKAHRLVASWIGQHDTPQTVYHVHGWAQILSPSIFAALAPVRHRTVLSAHDFFLACPNGAFVEFSTGEPCLRKPLSLSCLATGCDRRGGLDKAWRVLRHAMLGRWLDPAAVPMILTIHAAMLPYFERAGFPRQCLETLPNPVTPWSETRIPVEQNRKALFVGRLEATKGPDLAAAAAVAAGVELHVLGDGAMRPELEARYHRSASTAVAGSPRLPATRGRPACC
jgi:glycosyltransferase involved in cell wall biosynthesis